MSSRDKPGEGPVAVEVDGRGYVHCISALSFTTTGDVNAPAERRLNKVKCPLRFIYVLYGRQHLAVAGA